MTTSKKSSKAGRIVLVKFPFADSDSTKKRPALVINEVPFVKGSSFLTVAMITSQIDGYQIDGDVLLKNWQTAGLLHPSLVRLAKLATIENALVDKELGHLSSSDTTLVSRAFSKLFKNILK